MRRRGCLRDDELLEASRTIQLRAAGSRVGGDMLPANRAGELELAHRFDENHFISRPGRQCFSVLQVARKRRWFTLKGKEHVHEKENRRENRTADASYTWRDSSDGPAARIRNVPGQATRPYTDARGLGAGRKGPGQGNRNGQRGVKQADHPL